MAIVFFAERPTNESPAAKILDIAIAPAVPAVAPSRAMTILIAVPTIEAGAADEGASAGGENAQCRRGEVAERLKAAVC